jgi:hypothetical protein
MDGEPIAWKSHLGVSLSANRRLLKANAKGWGRSGALSDALITRQGQIDGFLAEVPNPNTPLFIGFSTLTASLVDKGRAHQDDLAFALRLTANGTLSFASAARQQQLYHAQSMEGDAIAVIEKGDAIGLRLTPDRKGLLVLRRTAQQAADLASAAAAAAAAGGAPASAASAPLRPKQYDVLKSVNEVMSFPMKVLVVFGGTTQLGPLTWLRGKGAPPPPANVAAAGGGEGSSATSAAAPESVVVRGRTAADLLGPGIVADDDKGRCLVMKASEEGSWAAGRVRVEKQQARHVPKADEETRKRASRALALQPKAVAKGARLLPRCAAARIRAGSNATHGSAPSASAGICASAVTGGHAASSSSSEPASSIAAADEDTEDADGKGSSSSSAEGRRAVPLSESMRALVVLARRSPFTSASECARLNTVRVEAAAGAEADEAITLGQLRALASALHRLMPRAGTSDLDPMTPPPPPAPPPLPTVQVQMAPMADQPVEPPMPCEAPRGRPVFFGPPSECLAQPASLVAGAPYYHGWGDGPALPHG